MRKVMTKEITFTGFNVSQLVMIDGTPVTKNLPSEIMLGNVSPEKAKKEMTIKHKSDALMLYNFVTKKEVFEMTIDKFLEHATMIQKGETS